MSADPLTVYLIGDSTMSEKEEDERPETGWGMPFADCFDDAVTVDNHARNGRSTSTFLEEDRWQPVVNNLSEGDYVFIQFGHNDEVPSKEQHTPEREFVSNLETFIGETRDQGGEPVLLTSIARREFDDEGRLEDTHRTYSDLTRGVAREHDVPLIDMDARSQALLSELGPEESKALYNHLEPGEHPNYPDGVLDDTHFSPHGARRMAELVLEGIEALDSELAARVEREPQPPRAHVSYLSRRNSRYRYAAGSRPERMDDSDFESEADATRADVAALFSRLGEELRDGNRMTLANDDERGTVNVPSELSLALEVEREQVGNDDHTEVEIELEWADSHDFSGDEVSDVIEADAESASADAADVSDESDASDASDATNVSDTADASSTPESDAPAASLGRFEVYRDSAGEWRWRLVHRNGNIIATSGEGYTSRQNAEKGMRSVVRNAPGAAVTDGE